MRSVHRSLLITAMTVLLTGITPAAAAPSTPQAAPDAAVRSGTVTLITGDQVTLHTLPGGKPGVTIKPAPGRERVSFTQGIGERGAISVYPFDAMAFVVAKKLDERLFNITDLVADQHARGGKVPLIVRYPTTEIAQRRTADLRIDGAEVRRVLPSINAVSAMVPQSEATRFWKGVHPSSPAQASGFADGIEKISRDGTAKPLDADTVGLIGAPAAWQRGQTAKGVKVAILDSGIDAAHPDLTGRIKETKDFTEAGIADDVGHGTHVAGIIAGTGPQPGVAPGADLYIGRVCEVWGCQDTAIIAGMEWAAQLGAKVVNLSLGGGPTDGTDELSQAVNTLTAKYGTLFVIAAGNEGADQSVGTPGAADAALTVGSSTKDGQLSHFSSRGPRVGDHAVKPEITAPGYAIIAARAAGTSMGYPINDRHTLASGTSMATPHVTGAAAILAGQHPDWSPARLKAALTSTSEPLSGPSVFEQGAGQVDIDRATARPVYAEPAVLNLTKTKRATITYRNDSDRPVRLDLRLPTGITADQKQFTLPAKGSAAVEFTAAAGATGGHLITARGGGDVVRTGVSTGLPGRPQHHVKIGTIDRNGAENGAVGEGFYAFGVVLAAHDLSTYLLGGVGGGQPVQGDVPAGRYTAFSWIPAVIDGRPPWEPSWTLVSQEVQLNKDTELVLDGRKAVEVTSTLNGVKPESSQTGDSFGFAGDFSVWAIQHNYGKGYVVPAKTPDMVYTTHQLIRNVPGSTKCGLGGASCAIGAVSAGTIDGTPIAPADADLATVHTDAGAPYGPTTVSRLDFAVNTASSGAPPGYFSAEGNAPGTLTAHYYNRGGAGWFSHLLPPTNISLQRQAMRQYAAGTEHTEAWAKSLLSPRVSERASVRTGNLMELDVNLASDNVTDHYGGISGDSKLELYRNGKLVDGFGTDTGLFQVPAARDRYRLVASGVQDTSAYNRASATWEFRSQRTSAATALPLSTVRFSDPLREKGITLIPFRVDRTATSGRTREVTVETSFDDGKTWTKAHVLVIGDYGVAKIQGPATGFLSLRAGAKDSDGNSVTQEVLHMRELG